ncbi:LOW QUALITY PROTEIN: thioester-containing protein 1 allele R1-like [Calliphora vicina]|uniref:LOW QUALITY PROTEIN: thioester-containing protein 1 allele R1-like n=1 Tax=Calliphora vicina TaxID=7373 RepID=UPI00325AEA2C
MYTKFEGYLCRSINQSYYSIIAPGLLKSNRKYTTVASLHDATVSCLLRISISGPQFNATEEISLKPFQSKIVDFYPPKLQHDMYTLTAEGLQGCSFNEEKQLLVETTAGPKIYIQTDKAVYKPEDLVQFRVLFLDEHTKPLNISEPILAEVLNAKENIVKTFKDIRFTKGVYTNNFQLSERPVLGSWSIRVSVGGMFAHVSSKVIQVKKYVLPKFSVHIRTAKHVITSDAHIKAMIYGKYTFGKYVQGVATVQLWNEVKTKIIQQQKIDVNTMAAVEFSLPNLNQTTLDNYIYLSVSLKENLTGIRQSESIPIMLHRQRYNIIVNENDIEFSDFEPYRLKVHIQYWNGAVVRDPNTPVILKYGLKTYETYMEDNGMATFEFENQQDYGYSIYFKDSHLYVPSVYRSVKEDNSSIFYCKLNLLDKRPHLGKPVNIEVSSTEDIPYLVYAIVGHGNIILMQHIILPPNQKSYIIHIKPSIEMIPFSYLYVHYSHNGILRQNEMELAFPRQFQNQISLVAPQNVKPGEEITVELNAQPQSFVGILAVDLGVHLLDPSYDLDRNKILKELAEDKSYVYSEYIQNGEISISGLVILTNIKRTLEEVLNRKKIRQSEDGEQDYRVNFPEVWIFQNVDINATNTKMTFKLPDSITTWRITAFSVNEKSGLGIVDVPTDVTAIKPFFISLNLPYSIKWGEIVAIGVLVFNYHSQSLDSSIVMHNNDFEFEFMESMADGTEKSKDQQRKLIKYVLPANDVQMFTFYIKPLEVGTVNLRISASNYLYRDAVHQQLKVESQGIDKKYNQPIYLNVFEFENQQDYGYSIYFKDSHLYVPSVYRSVKEDNSSIFYCKLNLLDKRPHLGKPVNIEVSSTEDIPYLVYAIVGHGNIILMQHIILPPNQKSYIIHIKPSIEMIPFSYLYVHYSHNGILRQNEMELAFPRQFQNQISLVAPQNVKPGEEITVELNAQPQSFVGILAVDLGVHLLDPSYDLDRNKILKELAEDKSYVYSEYIQNGEISISGLVILTNIKRTLEEVLNRKKIRQSEDGEQDYRVNFPEVWIFQNVDINATNTKMTFKLPDSITTWRITAFSVNEKSGLGIVDVPTDVTAIKPFFISLNLPYSIKWGEIVAIGVLVFNYHSQSLDSSIVMHNNDFEFEFMESMADGTEKSKDQQRKLIKYVLPANDVQMFTFYIKPLEVGTVNLRISASNYLYRDAVHQQLKVESQGIDKKYNQPIYLNVGRETPATSSFLQVNIPSNVEPTSSGIALTVGGDYIVPTFDNLQQLVEMPTGCGEQNMVHFAPNIMILQYLKATGEYAKESCLVATIKSYTDIGYQQQLSYRHDNGGYSVFGEDVDEEASTWLTAYTVRFFIKASKFASIERRIIETALKYLSNAQLNDGSFPYTGYLFDPAQKNRYGLTAFILATFLEDRMYARRYQQVINRGLQFLTNNLDDVDDVYALSIIAYVLQMAKNSNVNKVLEKLKIYRNESDGLVWWSGSNNFNENNVEITAYILMALLDSSASGDHKPILKWLIAQRNDKGGFLSTHDTVVGLQALVKFAQKIKESKNVNLDIKYTAKDQEGDAVKTGAFKVESGNILMTQKQELPKSTRNVSFEMTGTGSALLQLSHHYKILDASTSISPMIDTSGSKPRRKDVSSNVKTEVKYFIIEPKANILNNDLDLEICYTYTTSTNMVIMEVNLPSGYRTDDEVLENLKNNPFVQRNEPKNEYTTIILYLDKLEINEQNCLNILAYKTSDVFERKSVPIVMYDYYNTASSNSIFYNV